MLDSAIDLVDDYKRININIRYTRYHNNVIDAGGGGWGQCSNKRRGVSLKFYNIPYLYF